MNILPIMVKAKEILSQNDMTSEEKSGIGNIVTSTDKQLENLITNALQSKFPEAQIISEESAENTSYEINKRIEIYSRSFRWYNKLYKWMATRYCNWSCK